jgi:hypothetical protein
VLHLLEALQLLEMRVPGGGGAEKRRLSFRALDIEQIGHVYEGLLDHTAKRASEPVLGLDGAKDKEPEIPLSKLESEREKGDDRLSAFLKDETGRSENALRKGLDVELEPIDANRFQAACGGDHRLWERVKPFAGLVRDDDFGRPVVIPQGSVYVTAGTDRRSSGTHYTPKSLTEPIVEYTLEPLVYEGPAEGKPKEEWRLRSAKGLLDLNICDMACGSGAFLVQACRYMSERLMEAWDEAERSLSLRERAGVRAADTIRITPYGEPSSGKPGEMLIPNDLDERVVYARRIVAGRCLYGVDKNPLAAEMAKLSLWLLTLAKDKPFTFLDHAIRSGDSLVGIATTHQLTSFSLDGNGPDMPMFTDAIKKRLDAVRLLRRQIAELADNSAEDVEKKALMLQNAEQQTARLAYAANHVLTACWEATSETDRDERLKQALVHVEHNFKDLPVEQLEAEGRQRLQNVGCPKPFHWPLEFPEVFMQRGGFDAIVGNPPFLWGMRISTLFGDRYLAFLQSHFDRSLGTADLCAHFFNRAASHLRQNGAIGLLATDTISKGDTREASLNRICASGKAIFRSVSSAAWPGTASVHYASVHIFNGDWVGQKILNNEPVASISSYLSDEQLLEPYTLAANKGRVFIGHYPFGKGFILDEDQAVRFLKTPRNADVVFPYLTGEDVNTHPQQQASRYAINFGLRSEEDARCYFECFRVVEDCVKPERATNKRKHYRDKWWQYAEPRPGLCNALTEASQVFVQPFVSKYIAPVCVAKNQVFSSPMVVIPVVAESIYPAIQSSIHDVFVRQFATNLGGTLRYAPADCFEKYPLPQGGMAWLSRVADTYHEHRRQIMLRRSEGLTKTYNRFHDPDETAADIQKLRKLHVEMDSAVAAAYGWTDLDLGHGFHQTKQGIRYTISEPARREVLQRLLKLNHERYEEEVRQGLHEKKGKGKKTSTGKGRKKNAPNAATLFGDDDDDEGG